MRLNNAGATTLFVSLLSSMNCQAQPPAPPPPPPPGRGEPLPPGPAAQGPRTTVNGVVRSFNYGPGGLDGLVLDRGFVVHFPPEYGSHVSAAAPVGSAVAVSGWAHTGPAGDTLFDADAIANQRSRTSITIAGGPPLPPPGPQVGPGASPFAAPPPPPPPPGYAPGPVGYAPPPPRAVWPTQPLAAPVQQSVLTGPVRSFNYEVDGQVNGLILADGTAVYFPPEFAEQVTRAVAIGGSVRVTGSLRARPAGNRLLDAQSITNRKTGVSVTVPSFSPAP